MQQEELLIKKEWIIYGLIWLLVFQSPLELKSSVFKYIDELIAVFGVFFILKRVICKEQIAVSKDTIVIIFLLCIFVISGLCGNFMYQYQPLKAIVIDFFTNVKFFLAIAAGYYIFLNLNWKKMKKAINLQARIIAGMIFSVFLLDRVFNWFPGEIRYGLKSATLFFSHPTYLAGAMTFILALLIVMYERKNFLFIIMSSIVVAMSLRSKAIAAIVILSVLFIYITVFKKKIELWKVFFIGCACIVIAWPMIKFYYIDLAGKSARSIMMKTAFQILVDYFPIGTGFGAYASNMAAEYYSPVYIKYGFQQTHELSNLHGPGFFNDAFWPIIIGQTGLIGTISYVVILFLLFRKTECIYKINKYMFLGVTFIILYLCISSVAEPAFNNAIAIPLAFVLGMVFSQYRKQKLNF